MKRSPRPVDPRRRIGARGERLAARFLKDSGLQIIERNFRLRCGEIDLIALDGELVAFVEVKTRRGLGFGTPAESVTTVKQRKLARTAEAFLMRRNWLERSTRFDVIEVLLLSGTVQIRHISDAFRLWPGG